MLSLNTACEIAIDNFVKEGYLNGLVDIVDIGDCWLFFSRFSEEPGAEYGNCPYAVNKETGKYVAFPISITENFDMYYTGEAVEVPETYRLKK